MTEPQVTMIACPDCGMPIRASREHECDPAKAIHGLSLLRDHLEEELGKMRGRCQELEAQRGKEGELIDIMADVNFNLRARCETFEAERGSLVKERDDTLQELGDMQLRAYTAEYDRDEVRKERAEMQRQVWRADATVDRLIADLNRKTELAAALRCTCARLRNERDAQRALVGRLNTRGDKAEAELYTSRTELVEERRRVERLTMERDEARQCENAKPRSGLFLLRQHLDELARMQKYCEELEADLRAQLAEARNKTLATNRAVIGALQSAIDAHGPIDKSQLTSAAKRILGALNGGS